MQGQLKSAQIAMSFITAGKSTFTIRSKVTQNRFTYKVKKVKDATDLFFVSLMTGPDNTNSYSYMGVIRRGTYAQTAKSRVAPTAPSHLAFNWFWKNLGANQLPHSVEAWHEGRCGACNRKLTVPSSIEAGIGPECSKRR